MSNQLLQHLLGLFAICKLSDILSILHAEFRTEGEKGRLLMLDLLNRAKNLAASFELHSNKVKEKVKIVVDSKGNLAILHENGDIIHEIAAGPQLAQMFVEQIKQVYEVIEVTLPNV